MSSLDGVPECVFKILPKYLRTAGHRRPSRTHTIHHVVKAARIQNDSYYV